MADAARDAVLLCRTAAVSRSNWKNKQARRVVPARFSFSVPLRVFISAVYMNMYCKFRAFFLRSLVMC